MILAKYVGPDASLKGEALIRLQCCNRVLAQFHTGRLALGWHEMAADEFEVATDPRCPMCNQLLTVDHYEETSTLPETSISHCDDCGWEGAPE